MGTGNIGNMIKISDIDSYLSQQGRFCLIDWLIAQNILYYADYEAWRYGRNQYLIEAINLDSLTLQSLIDATEGYCQDLNLISEQQFYYRWNSDQRVLLTTSSNHQKNHQLGQHWLRPQDLPQLDLFMDNSAQMAENALLEALSGRQFSSAQSLLHNLIELNSESNRLGGYQDLINYGLHMQENPQVDTHSLGSEWQGLQQEVLPLAQEILGHDARDYVSFAWRRLGENMAGLAFDATNPELHASAVFLAIPDYPALNDCLLADPELYLQPILLERLAMGFHAMRQNEQAMIIWCLLMELAPEFAEQAIGRYPSHQIHDIWLDFWEQSDDWDYRLFPAYVLIQRPAIIHFLENFNALKQPSNQAMVALLTKRLNNQDEISARQALQEISPELLSIYLDELR
ncbi:MAG: hypothetical protein ACI8XC_003479 [Gammaproteobacteria bacterium]|jgi:hypothetical protein